MAVQERMALNTGSDLDSLIHSLEYENQQYVKMIEKENQRIQYLEAQEQEKTQAITELQTCLTNLELDTKNNHRQLVHNKNTLESLKKTKTVLQVHRDALQKQLEMLQFENDEQRREFDETIQQYEKTWTDYDAIYKSLPLYKTLLEAESRLAESEAEHTKWQRQKNELNRKMQATRDEMDFRDWQRFCIRIADKWLSSRRKKKELMDAVVEKETLQAKMEEIRGKNNSSLNTTGLPETSQDMDTEDTQAETSPDLTSSEESVTERDTTLTERGAGDGGDVIATSVTGTRKDTLGEVSASELQNEPSCQLTQNKTFVVNKVTVDSPNPAELQFPNSNTAAKESTEQHPYTTIQEIGHADRFEPSNTSTPVVCGAKPATRRVPQLSSTPTMPMAMRPPVVSVPRMSHPSAPQGNFTPRPVQVPFIAVPSRPPLAPKLASSKIPTVRSAVASMLTGTKPDRPQHRPAPVVPSTKPATDRPQQRPAPVVPKISMPRTPLLAPPPSPLLPSPRLYCPPETSKTRVSKNGVAKAASVAVSVPVLSAPVVPPPRISSAVPGRGRVQGSVPRPVLLAPPSPVVAVPASVSQLPRPMKPPGKEPSPPYSKISAARRPPTASSAGDAPMTTGTGKSNSQVNKDAADVYAASQDEEMECEIELRGSQQSVSSDEISMLSQGYSSQGQGSNPYSPFNMQKHVDRIMELQQDEDDFNPFVQPNKDTGPFRQPHFCAGRDNTTAEKTTTVSTGPSSSSVFNMGFMAPPVTPKQPMTPLLNKPTSPSAPPHIIKATSPGREERGGSFFSFESMDTGENSGGLSLLSMFGDTTKEPEPEAPFSFSFGSGSSKESAKDSGFSFSFGGGGEGGEETSGSIFSLF